MRCDTATGLVIDSLIDQLDVEEAGRLEFHLANCPSCSADAAALRRLWGDLQQTTAPSAEPAAAVRFGRTLATRSRRGRWIPLLRVAAVIALVGVGMTFGLFLAGHDGDGRSGASIESPAFILLLRGNEPNRRMPEQRLVREYSEWATRLRQAGRLVAAEKLTPGEGRWVTGADSESTSIGGFFVIVAADYDEAERIARASPHAAYGGTIEIRAIDSR